MKIRAISLRAKSLVMVAGMLLLVATAGGLTAQRLVRVESARTREFHADLLAVQLIARLDLASDHDAAAALQHRVNETLGNDSVLYCAIVDGEGACLALATAEECSGDFEHADLSNGAMVDLPVDHDRVVREWPGLHGVFPQTPELPGQIILGIRHPDADPVLADANNQIWLCVLAAVAAAAFFAWLSTQSLIAPISRLIAATREMTRGNYQVSIKARGRDEMTLLAHSFNRMATKIRKTRNDLQEHNQFLEQEVARRTALLNTGFAELQRIDAVKSNLLQTVARRFREPLSACQNAAKNILGGGPDRNSWLRQLTSRCTAFHTEVQDALDCALIESPDVDLEDHGRDPIRAIQAAVQPIVGRCEERGIGCHTDYPEQTGQVNWPERRLTRVLQYLMAKILSTVCNNGEFWVTATTADGRLRIVLANQHLHGVLSSSNNTWVAELLSEQFLGMKLCEDAVRRHGGELRVVETLDSMGFIVELPLVLDAIPA